MSQYHRSWYYRPEVDGLRAIAVLAVITYHSNIFIGSWHLLKGGYLGVDIFFVISGFLITSLLNREFTETGRISLPGFFERRARRLLPALLTVATVSVFYTQNALFPSQIKAVVESLISSLFFVGNIYWFNATTGYGAENALLLPFLHTWSLGVEEQYYLVFPLLMLAVLNHCREKAGLFFLLLLFSSLCLAVFLTRHYPSFSFFMLPSRMWEFLAGSLLAHSMFSQWLVTANRAWCWLLSLAGLLFIMIPMMTADLDSSHPGIVTILPVTGTVLLIASAHENNIITRLLSLKWLVGIGLISYSLYLWHYPLLAFGHLSEESPEWTDKVRWLLMALVFTLLTYFLIERPCRNRVKISRRTFFGLLVVASSVLLGVLVYFLLLSSTLIVSLSVEDEMNRRFEWQQLGTNICVQHQATDCAGNPEQPKLLVIGDSMAPDALRIVAGNFPRFFYVLSSEGYCVPTREPLLRAGTRDNLPDCNRLNDQRFDAASVEGVDGVVILTLAYDDDTFERVEGTPDLSGYLSFLNEQGISNILLMGSYLRLEDKMSDLYLKYGGEKQQISKQARINNINNDELLAEYADRFQTDFVSVRRYACSGDDGCLLFVQDTPFTWDNHHWSVEFTNMLAAAMQSELATTWLSEF